MNEFSPDEIIEEQLRRVAPELPSAFKARTLRRCAADVQARARHNRRTQRRLWGAVVAVFAVQWLVVHQLDAQNATFGGSPTPLIAATDAAEQNENWRGVWRDRAMLLSLLDDDSALSEIVR